MEKRDLLSTLDPMGFAKLIPEREARIAKADIEEYKRHPANALAEKLHPAVQHLFVSDVTEETKNTKTYTLKADEERGTESLAYFDAGQYLSVRIEADNIITQRPYSISSSPEDALGGFYKITVKAVEGGFVSNYILKNWKVGTKVVSSAPLGSFTYEPLRDCKNVVALCGGSGITPILSLAKAVSEGTEELCLTVLYGSRGESDIICRRELDILSEKCENVKVVYVLSEEKKEGFESGFITAELIKKYAPDTPYSVFMCGPEAMYKSLEGELSCLSLERKYIRREVQGERFSPPADALQRVCVTVKQGDKRFFAEGDGKDTILRILEKNGVCAPSHCRSGGCGFCRARLVSGKVYVPEGLDRRRLADAKCGYVHPCCTYAVTDVEIEIFPER